MSSALRPFLPGFNSIDAQKAPRLYLPERDPGSQKKMSSGNRKTKMSSGVLQTEFPEFMSVDRADSARCASYIPRGARLLDLCCGNGIAAWGYWLSGLFDEIVGIDLYEQPAYPFTFIQRDAFTLDYEFLAQFDFIHASPPCQGYSKMTPPKYKGNHPLLIPAAHLMLQASGLPYVIENVEGSGHHLRPNLVIDGGGVGFTYEAGSLFPCEHAQEPYPDDKQLLICSVRSEWWSYAPA